LRRLRLIVGLAALVALAAAPAANATPKDARLRAVETWAFAIGDGARAKVLRRPAAFDLVVVDGEDVTGAQVRKLRRRGAIVLGYVSVGTIESYRWWYRAASPYKLELWGDWGEWYADVAQAGFRNLIAGRVAPRMLRKRLDGLFLDNTDMIETHPAQRAGMRALVARLGRLVHRRSKLLFSQNGEDSIGPSLRHYAGWNREDVSWTYDFGRKRYVRVGSADRASALAAVRRIKARGLLVTTTDYLPAGRRHAALQAIRASCRAGALPYVSNIGLSRVPGPVRC
jgi:uncharacterized protein (TIGR01370 family)